MIDKSHPIYLAPYGCKCGGVFEAKFNGLWFDLKCPDCGYKQGFRQ